MAASFPQEWSREKDIESYHDALYDLISPLIVFVRSKSATLTERERISLGCEFWKLGIMRGHLGGQLPLLDAKKTIQSILSSSFYVRDTVLGATATTVSGKYVSCPHKAYNPVGKPGVKKLEYEYYIRKSDGSRGGECRRARHP